MNSKINIINSADNFLLNSLCIIWKEKIIVLITILAFLIASNFYFTSKPKQLISEIVINNPPSELFAKYEIDNQNKTSQEDDFRPDLLNSYIQSVTKNMLSSDNFSEFINNEKLFENFINNLKSKNISVTTFFKNNFNQVKIRNNKIENTYSLKYLNNLELNGQLLLNKYVEFTVKKILSDYKQRLKNSIVIHINQLRLSYDIADTIGIELPTNQTSNFSDPTLKNFHMMGTKVISKYILNYQKIVNELEKDNFDYKFILDRASMPTEFTLSKYIYLSVGFVFGLIFSLILIFIKTKLI